MHNTSSGQHSILIQSRSTSVVQWLCSKHVSHQLHHFNSFCVCLKWVRKSIIPPTLKSSFLGLARCPSGWVYAARHNNQSRIVLCNSEAVMAHHSKPTVGPTVKWHDSPTWQCTSTCCCQNASNVSRVGWEVFEHPAYIPELAQSDWHLFSKLKEFLGGRHFRSNEAVTNALKQRINVLAVEIYDEGIQKLITHYVKCLNVGGDLVEK